jgi:hypothetical protein
MKVRDKTLPKTDYKGRETEARDAACPCKPCYHAHDCGYTNSQGKWVMRMSCATRWNYGCPEDTRDAPEHVYSLRGRVCKRCGLRK